MELIKSPSAFRGVLRRLRATNDGVMFWNRDETLKIMLRNDPDVELDAHVGIEVCLVVTTEKMRRLIHLEHGGYLEHPGDIFVLDAFEFEEDELEKNYTEILNTPIAFINEVFHFTLCSCGRLIKDDSKLCMYCHLTSSDSDLEREQCFVCHQKDFARFFETLPCCRQRIHSACLEKWHESRAHFQQPHTCPHCRSSST